MSLDEADTRRGGEAVHKLYSNKVAVLAGDYLLARASVLLARLENTAVVQIMATASGISRGWRDYATQESARVSVGDGNVLAQVVLQDSLSHLLCLSLYGALGRTRLRLDCCNGM